MMGFLTMRYLVFTPVSHPLIEYLRYQVVYLPILMVNLVVLPLSLKYSDLNAYVIQALFAMLRDGGVGTWGTSTSPSVARTSRRD